jgi:hypothetical protein
MDKDVKPTKDSLGLKELIRKIKQELLESNDSEPKIFLVGPIDLEISFTVEWNARGGVTLSVVDAGADRKSGKVHTVKIRLEPLMTIEQLRQRVLPRLSEQELLMAEMQQMAGE